MKSCRAKILQEKVYLGLAGKSPKTDPKGTEFNRDGRFLVNLGSKLKKGKNLGHDSKNYFLNLDGDINLNLFHLWSSPCGTEEMNPTSIHEDVGSIPSLAQWVRDQVLL